MTDDCEALKNALAAVWPETKQLLCDWHVQQAVWRWLWKLENGIEHEDRPILMKLFQALVYASTSEAYENAKEALFEDEVCLSNKNFLSYIIQNYCNRPEIWSYATRFEKKLPTHGNNTSNFIESSFNILKSKVFKRHKAFNLVQLWDILQTSSEVYKQKCINIGNGRMGELRSKNNKYDMKDVKTKKSDIIKLNETRFIVPSKSKQDINYSVDMKSGYCECFKGVNLGPCSHKNAVAKHFGVAEFSVLPDMDGTGMRNMRAMYHYIGSGITLESHWYSSSNDINKIPNTKEFVQSKIDNNSPIKVSYAEEKYSESEHSSEDSSEGEEESEDLESLFETFL